MDFFRAQWASYQSVSFWDGKNDWKVFNENSMTHMLKFQKYCLCTCELNKTNACFRHLSQRQRLQKKGTQKAQSPIFFFALLLRLPIPNGTNKLINFGTSKRIHTFTYGKYTIVNLFGKYSNERGRERVIQFYRWK